jgi:hypothetical protein
MLPNGFSILFRICVCCETAAGWTETNDLLLDGDKDDGIQ